MNDPVKDEDILIGALLRAAAWLEEAGAGLLRSFPPPDHGSTVAETLKLEAGYARDAAFEAMWRQNKNNLSGLPSHSSGERR